MPAPVAGTQAVPQSGSNDDASQTLPPVDQSTTLPPLDPGHGDQSAAQPTATAPISSLPPIPTSPDLAVHAPTAMLAEDVDLIEKEWVSKAKTIIKNTSNNPNQQSKDMSKFKADYLKTRYGKDLKVNE